jgi:acyl-[acyl-carrier-protein]-phospholipid O-acyltransferase/long-chain-fatty-acid--[acyl-carrier-protein] ligase
VEQVPARGGAILVANHISYADAAVLQIACRRPIRFVGYHGYKTHWFFGFVFRLAGVILISPERPRAGLRRAIDALKAGEIVCVFPEGAISRIGQLMRLHRGFVVMARSAEVPVIPVSVDGLWGSVFSFSGDKYLWKPPRIMPTDVFVAFGGPIPPGKADMDGVRSALLDLGAEAFAERPHLRRHLGRELARALAKQPGRCVVVDRTAERRVVKAFQLFATAAIVSRWLKRHVAQQRVGIVLPPGAGALVANLAVVWSGKVPVNCNFTASRDSIAASLKLAGVATVISADAMREKLPAFPWPDRTIDLRTLIGQAGGRRAILPWALAAWILPNQWVASLLRQPSIGDGAEAYLIFTSGSSGEPKGVVLSHRNILANCAQISSTSILPRNAVLLGCLPLFHSFGSTATLWYPILRGCGLVTVSSPLDSRRIVEAIRDEHVTVMIGAPTFLRPLLKKAQPHDLRSLDRVVSGAEKLPPELNRDFKRVFNVDILEGYGLTETSPVSNVCQPDPPSAAEDRQTGRKAGTVGRLMPGMTARIVDADTGAFLPLSSTGIVALRGPNVFGGYLDNKQATDAVLRDGWFVTGDIGRFDEDGFLTIDGRVARFSKVGGEMIPHGVIEQELVAAFDIDQSERPAIVVLGVPDSVRGEELVVLATLDLDPELLRTRLSAAGLPNLWIPRHIIRVEKIPILGSGKLDIRACRETAIAAESRA